MGCGSVTGFLHGLSLGLYLAVTKVFGELGAGGGSSGSDQGALADEALLTASLLYHSEHLGPLRGQYTLRNGRRVWVRPQRWLAVWHCPRDSRAQER